MYRDLQCAEIEQIINKELCTTA